MIQMLDHRLYMDTCVCESWGGGRGACLSVKKLKSNLQIEFRKVVAKDVWSSVACLRMAHGKGGGMGERRVDRECDMEGRKKRVRTYERF